MAMDDERFCLTEEDLAHVERLWGRELDCELRDFLLEHYGARSWYTELRRWMADAKERCDEHCEDCYACEFDDGDPLLTRVFRIVSCHDRDLFDIGNDCYSDACDKMPFRWALNYDPDIPF